MTLLINAVEAVNDTLKTQECLMVAGYEEQTDLASLLTFSRYVSAHEHAVLPNLY